MVGLKSAPTVEQPWRELRRLGDGLLAQSHESRARRSARLREEARGGTVRGAINDWPGSGDSLPSASARGELANRILAQGKTIKTEEVFYRAFQRCFGRSAQVSAVAGVFT